MVLRDVVSEREAVVQPSRPKKLHMTQQNTLPYEWGGVIDNRHKQGYLIYSRQFKL